MPAFSLMTQRTLDFWRGTKRPRPDEDEGSAFVARESIYDSSSKSTDKEEYLKNKMLPEKSREDVPVDAKTPFIDEQLQTKSNEGVFSDGGRLNSPSKSENEITSTVRTSPPPRLFTNSQRIVKNGERMVTNSDEDDDSSSLEDLDVLLGRQKPNDKRLEEPPRSTAPSSSVGMDVVSRTLRTRGGHDSGGPSKLRNASPPGKKGHRFSLSYLAEQSRRYEKSNQDVARADALLSTAEFYTNSGAGEAPPELLLKTMMDENQDKDDIERLKNALKNTEALRRKRTWSFFRVEPQKGGLLPPEFPRIDDLDLQDLMRNQWTRQRTFLCGYVGEYARWKILPDEMLIWIIRSIPFEERHDLRAAYVQTLVDAQAQIATSMTVDHLKSVLDDLGASSVALDTKGKIEPKAEEATEFVIDNAKLSSLLQVLGSIATTANPEFRRQSLILVCRLLLDQKVCEDCHLLLSVEECVTSLSGSMSGSAGDLELESVIASIRESVQDMSLRIQLLNHLPVATPATAILRRKLATAFLFDSASGSPNLFQRSMTSTARHLRRPEFSVDNRTDYDELTCLVSILNISTDSGDRPATFPTEEEENGFNRTIDMMSARLREISAQIIDTGALSMGRTEAKQALDNFLRRLSYAVRSEPPPKKTILGDPVESYAAEKAGMEAWIKSGKGYEPTHNQVPIEQTASQEDSDLV